MSTSTQDIPAGMANAPSTKPTPYALQGAAPEATAAQSATRVYRGRTVEELIPKIQAELGPDAIVVRRHKGLTGGIAGFFQRPFVEIEAKLGTPRVDVYDEDGAAPALPPALEQAAPALGGDIDARTLEQAFRELTPADLIGSTAGSGGPAGDGRAEQTQQPHTRQLHLQQTGSQQPNAQEADVQQAAANGGPFAAALAAAEAAVPTVQRAHAQPLPAEAEGPDDELHTPALPARSGAGQAPRGRARARIEASLLGFGVSEALVEELIETAAAHVLPVMPARCSLARAVQLALAQRIPKAAPLPLAGATIALVGPGGSGKTACCTALLDAYRERSTLPATCATLLAGQTPGELAALIAPHVLTPTPVTDAQLTRTLRHARREGLLLLDLPSLSPTDRGAIRATATLLASMQPDRVVLALPATMGARAAAQLLEALRPLGASALAVTHADETDQLGVAVEAACNFGLAPEYLLDRTRGRAGLTQTDPTYLAERLLP
jgi:flagellar biosynthesis GTPase FlhF